MQKVIAIAVVVLVALIGGGWLLLSQTKETGDKKASPAETVTEEAGVTGWVRELMSGGKMECTYAISEEGQSSPVKMYMDKDRYRTEMDIPNVGKMVSVFDGKVSYSWTEGSKQGMRMPIDCFDDVKPIASQSDDPDTVDLPEEESFKSPEDALQSIPDISCTPVSLVDFSVPSDVAFTDQCEMLKSQMKAMEQYKNQIPVGSGIPENVRGLIGQ